MTILHLSNYNEFSVNIPNFLQCKQVNVDLFFISQKLFK